MQYIKTNRLICNNTLPRTKTFIVKVSAKPFTFQVLDLKLEKRWWLASYVNCTTLCLEVDRHRYESWLLPYHQRKKCKTHERHTKVVYSTKENETYSSIQLVFKHTTCLGYQRWQSQLFHNVIQHHRQKLLHHTIMSTQTYQVMTSMSFTVHILL